MQERKKSALIFYPHSAFNPLYLPLVPSLLSARILSTFRSYPLYLPLLPSLLSTFTLPTFRFKAIVSVS